MATKPGAATTIKPASTPAISNIHPDCNAPPRATMRFTTTKLGKVVSDDDEDKPLKGGKGFMFDIAIVRIDIPNKSVNDTCKLKVDVNFNGTDLSITSSRINVLDFKDGRSHEFVANPLTLKDQLAKKPLKFKVSDDDSVLGYGTIEWPAQFLFGLIECAGQMIHSDETEIKECNGNVIGILQVYIRLQPTCEEYEENNTIEDKCRNANKEIRPNDILFVVGKDKNPCCCSQVGIIPASDSDQTLNPKCLDLSNFRAVNCQTVQSNTNILSALDPACQGIKAVSNYYQNLIDSVMGKKKSMPKFKLPPYCQDEKHSEKYLGQSSYFDQKPYYCSTEALNEIPTRCHSFNKGDFAGNSVIQVAQKESSPDLVENVPDVTRRCPICNDDMSFLPKLAACPNCCYKPVPYFEEKPYDDNKTADQLLERRFDTNQETDSNAKDQLAPACRCTCKHGKTCAFCRIRLLCGDVLTPPSKNQPENTLDQKISEADCPSSVDNRPFLTKVFSEFKDLFDLNKAPEPSKRCEKEVKKNPQNELARNKMKIDKLNIASENQKNPEIINNTSAKQHGPEIKKQRKCCRAKKSIVKPAAKRLVKSRLYDYQPVHSYKPAYSKHKTCMNGFAGRKNVPPNMGWLWNVNNTGVHAKWKPGAICKPIKELMSYFLKDYPVDTLLVSQYSYRKKRRNEENQQLPILIQKPTLHISKKNGEYVITMRPLKDPETLKKAADPYENMKPVQFRIKKCPQSMEMRKLKQCLKDMGFKKCSCHKPIIHCYCRNFLDKKKLEFECNKECRKRNLPPCVDTLVLSDTSESEGEFDFGVTPPVGVIKPERLIKRNLVNESTQYVESDWNKTPLFPKPPNKYMAMYQCAVGERKGGKSNASGGGRMNGADGGVGGTGSGKCPGGVGGGRGGSGGGMAGVSGVAGDVAINFSGKYGGRPVGGRGVGGQGVGGRSVGGRGVGGQGVGGPGVGGRNVGGRGVGGQGVGGQGVGARVSSNRKAGEEAPQKPFDMMKYLQKANKRYKMTGAEAAAKRKEKMRLLRGASPPLLCTVDRRGKPFEPCAPVFSCGDNRIC